MSTLKKLSVIMRRTLNPNYKALYQAGFLDESLKITDEGRYALDHITLQAHEDALVERAKEVIAEKEAEEAKNK